MLTPTMQTLSVLSSMFVVAVLSLVLLRQDIREGIIIKIGLSMVVMALLGSMFLSLQETTTAQGWANVGLALRVGLAITCVGVLWRAHLLGNARRHRNGTCNAPGRLAEDLSDMLKSDWAELEDK